jgi:DNA-binding NtrC family response regulator
MKKVLLIDDDESVLFFFQRAMDSLPERFDLVTTSDPLKGIEALRKDSFDVVFLDLKLGVLTGEEVFLKIRSIDRELKRFTPVVIFSGFIDHATAPGVLKHGFAAFVYKPEHYNQDFFSCLFQTFGLIK